MANFGNNEIKYVNIKGKVVTVTVTKEFEEGKSRTTYTPQKKVSKN